MEHSFFLDQLTQARAKFTLEPEVIVYTNNERVPVDQIRVDTNYNNRQIVLHVIGGNENWKEKYQELKDSFHIIKSQNEKFEKELAVHDEILSDKDDEIEDLEGDKEDLNLEIAELCSKIEDLEEEIGEMRRKNQEKAALAGEIKKTLIVI